MPVKELVDKYGGAPREALRRAVRAETPGGSELLDALAIVAKNRDASPEWRRANAALIRVREAMISEIARRYDFKSVAVKNERERVADER